MGQLAMLVCIFKEIWYAAVMLIENNLIARSPNSDVASPLLEPEIKY